MTMVITTAAESTDADLFDIVTAPVVVGAPDDRLGEVPWAFLVLRPSPDLPAGDLPADLQALCRDHLAPYKVPAGFEVIAELPRNEVGKVLARELLERIGVTS